MANANYFHGNFHPHIERTICYSHQIHSRFIWVFALRLVCCLPRLLSWTSLSWIFLDPRMSYEIAATIHGILISPCWYCDFVISKVSEPSNYQVKSSQLCSLLRLQRLRNLKYIVRYLFNTCPRSTPTHKSPKLRRPSGISIRIKHVLHEALPKWLIFFVSWSSCSEAFKLATSLLSWWDPYVWHRNDELLVAILSYLIS